VVDAHDLSVLSQTEGPVLTLITCCPFWILGNAPDRFIVRAVAVDDETVSPPGGNNTPAPLVLDVPGYTGDRPDVATGVRVEHRTVSDEASIRETLARFRVAYNSRLTRESPAARSLMFAACEISVNGDAGLAACRSSEAASAAGLASEWAFTLQRVGAVWAIRGIVTK